MEGRGWEELPFDCLISIFNKLNLEDLTLGVPLVCKSFHRASMDPQCWKILDFQVLDFSPNSKFIARFKQECNVKAFSFTSFLKLCSAKSHGCATNLSIPYIKASPLIPDLIQASIECPRLKTLTLPTLLHQTDKQIAGLIGEWKELETLELKWKPKWFVEMVEKIRANCPNFTCLRIRGAIDKNDVNAIAKNFPRLKSLAITSSHVRREELVTILDQCDELEELDLSKCIGFIWDKDMLKQFSAKINEFVYDDCKVEYHAYRFYDDLFSAMIARDY